MASGENMLYATLDRLSNDYRTLGKAKAVVEAELATLKRLTQEFGDYMGCRLEVLVQQARLALDKSRAASKALRDAGQAPLAQTLEAYEYAAAVTLDTAMEIRAYFLGLRADPAFPAPSARP